MKSINIAGVYLFMLQRFLPSEFGHDVVRAVPVEPGEQMYKDKRVIRQLIEEYSIPYNYICCNSIASWPYYDNKHPANVLPPLDHFKIYGDGTVRGTPRLSATPLFCFFWFVFSACSLM